MTGGVILREPASGDRDASAPGRASKANQVYETVKEAILSGDMAPGSAIDKAALCDRLGVSRFPVTAAVNRLGFEKLVVIEPQHGSFVSRISIADVKEFMLVRRALEAEMASVAAGGVHPGLNDELDRNLRYQAAAASARDTAGFYRLDVAFHRIIAQALGLGHAAEILDRLLSHLERVRRLGMTPPGRAQQTLKEHARIAGAIAAGEPAAAAAAARAHLDSAEALFETLARDHPLLFAETASHA